MSTTDVHRMLDNKLPEGKKCTAVSMYLVYTVTIDGDDVTVSVESGLSEDDIAARIVAEVGTPENAAAEGAEITEADEAMGGPEPEYDDSDEYEKDEVEDHSGDKPKSKAKSKKK